MAVDRRSYSGAVSPLSSAGKGSAQSCVKALSGRGWDSLPRRPGRARQMHEEVLVQPPLLSSMAAHCLGDQLSCTSQRFFTGFAPPRQARRTTGADSHQQRETVRSAFGIVNC